MASSGVPRLLNSVLVVDSAPPGPGFVAALVGELSRAGHAVTQVASFRAAKAVVGSDAGQGLSAVVVALPSPEYEEREHPQAFGRKTDPSGAPASLTWSVPDRPGRPRSTSPSRFSDSGESRASTLRSPEIIIAGALADAPQPATSPVLRRRGDELAEDLVRTVRAKINVEVPIAILAEPGEDDDAEEQGLPDWVSQLTNEIIFKDEQSASHVASRLSAKITKYVSSILAAAPFFDALVRFAREAHYSWHTPGHSGGQAFLRTPTGSAFHSFFGEPLFRTDLSVSVAQLGSLNDHTGPLKLAERRAAKLFGADRTYFVTNGTSTSNRIIIGACVTRGDRTLVDRNCHKSVIQGMQMTGGVPTYLLPKRNGLGIIGPVPPAALTKEAIWASIRANPLSSSYDGPEDIVYAVVTNSTYDGLCYHAGRVKSLLDPSGLMRLSFDEAWFAYARFHPLYRNRFAMQSLEDDGARRASTSRRPLSGTGPNGLNATAPALGRPLPTGPTVLATHSTHKLLASLSQAALLHIRQGSRGQIDHARFNESFMMNSSTSPQYAIMASIDVAGAMMENSMPGRIGDGTGLPSGSLPSGPSTDGAPGTARASWGSTVISASIIEAVRFRRRMVRMGDSYRAQEMRNRMRAQERAKANGLPMPEDDPNVLSPGWWFEVWQPTVVPGSMTVPASERKPFVEVDFDRLISDPDCWLLHPDDEWHGFKGLEDGYCLLDPIKVTILTPGGNVDGSICGIPAAIVTKFLDKRGIQVEKTGDYSLLFLFSIGVTESKWMTLLNSLAEFKRLYDGESALLADVLPELPSTWPQVYGSNASASPRVELDDGDSDGEGLAEGPILFSEFCQEMHAFKRAQNHLRLLVKAFDRPPCPKLTPAEAYRRLVKNDVEAVPLDKLMGRIVAVSVTPYPPGIPVLMPGECAGTGPDDAAVLEYLLALGEFDRRWPGFEHDVHGVEWDERSRKFRVLCVKEPCVKV